MSLDLVARRMLVTFGSLVAMAAKRSRLCDEWGTENLGRRQWRWLTVVFGQLFHDWNRKEKGQRKTFLLQDRESKGSQP